MTISDDQLLRAVRDSVAARSAVGGPVEEVLRRGRRRSAARRGVTAGVVGLLGVGAAVAVQVTGLPSVSSSPPAAPSVTIAPAPATNLDDAAAMRPAVEEALAGVGLTLPSGNFAVSYSRAGDHPVSGGVGVVASASTSVPSVLVSTAHVQSGVAVESAGCEEAVVARPDSQGCTPQPQPDGSLLLDLEYEAGARELVLLHPTGWVLVAGETADLGRLRALVLDPTLRW